MKNILHAILFLMMLIAMPSFGQNLGEMQQSIKDGLNSMIGSLDAKKLTATPQRDLLTLAIGGVAGFAAGSFFSSLGLIKFEVLGVALIPVIGGLAGIYFANDGYFDSVREVVTPNNTPAVSH